MSSGVSWDFEATTHHCNTAYTIVQLSKKFGKHYFVFITGMRMFQEEVKGVMTQNPRV